MRLIPPDRAGVIRAAGASMQCVVGEGAHPLFRHIVAELGPQVAPRWNFHKYLVTPEGALAGAWPSRIAPTSPEIVAAIEAVLPR